MTKDEYAALSCRAILEHKKAVNKDGTPLRCRVNGKIKTWVTRPEQFSLPVKHGLYDHGYITHENACDWKKQ